MIQLRARRLNQNILCNIITYIHCMPIYLYSICINNQIEIILVIGYDHHIIFYPIAIRIRYKRVCTYACILTCKTNSSNDEEALGPAC